MLTPHPAAIAVILGSAFEADIAGLELSSQELQTPWGQQQIFAVKQLDRPAYLLFRHGLPHQLLPNQINYRAQAWALSQLGVRSLLVTSSVGVMTDRLPLNQPLLLSDILMPDNRLPDGSACSLFTQPTPGQGHLVLDEGLCSRALNAQLTELARSEGVTLGGEAVFAYVGGPRTKTAAENRFWALAGAQVNAMTLAPEMVLANELGIATSGLVVGHKYSLPNSPDPMSQQNREQQNLDQHSIAQSLVDSRQAMESIIRAFVQKGMEVPFANHLFQFDYPHDANHPHEAKT